MTPEAQITTSKLAASPAPRTNSGSDSSRENVGADAGFSDVWANGQDSAATPEIGLGQIAVSIEATPINGRQALAPNKFGTMFTLPTPEPSQPLPERTQSVMLPAGPPPEDAVKGAASQLSEIRSHNGDDRTQVPAGSETHRLSATSRPDSTAALAAGPTPEKSQAAPDIDRTDPTFKATPQEALGRESPNAKAPAEAIAAPISSPKTSLPPLQTTIPKPKNAMDGTISLETGVSAAEPVELELRQTETARLDPARPELAKPESSRPETARHVSGQIVEAIRQGRDGSIDVSLNPEELGRVRLILSGTDAVLHVTIQSERPETGDLLRRHIAQLQQDFQDLGYVDVSIDFGQSPGQSPERNDQASFDEPPMDEATPQRTDLSSGQSQIPATKVNAGLDLRL